MTPKVLSEALTDGWLACAPRDLADRFAAARANRPYFETDLLSYARRELRWTACQTSTRTVITTPCCGRTGGAPPRTPPPTCCRSSHPRMRDPRRRLRSRHDHRGPGRRVPHGHVTGIDAVPDIVEQAGSRRSRATTSTSRPATSTRSTTRTRVRRGARPPGAAAPDRPGPGAARDAPGHQARRPGRGPRRRLRRHGLVPGPARSSASGGRCTSGSPAAAAASPTPAAGCTPGPGQRA